METSKEERPVVAKKRPFVKEDEPVEAKSRRTENLDSQESKVDEQITQEKHQIMEGPVPFKQHWEYLKELQASKSKLQAQIDKQLALCVGFSGPRGERRFRPWSNDSDSSELSSDTETGLPDKISEDPKFFSFDLFNYLDVLPSNRQHLEEFQIKGHHDRAGEEKDASVLENQSNQLEALMKYLEKCPNLKILKIEYEGDKYMDIDDNHVPGKWRHLGTSQIPDFHVSYFSLKDLESNACGTPRVLSMKFQNLEELHLSGFGLSGGPENLLKILNTFHRNLPKLRRLYLILDIYDGSKYFKILQKFASEKNITVEFAGMPKYDLKPVLVKIPNLKIFNPEQGGEDLDGKGLDEKGLGELEEDLGE